MFHGYSSKISKYYSIDNISVGTLFQKDTSLGTQLCQVHDRKKINHDYDHKQ